VLITTPVVETFKAIAETKRLVDIASLPTDAEIAPEVGRLYCFGWAPLIAFRSVI
jgi:hypothetical protein